MPKRGTELVRGRGDPEVATRRVHQRVIVWQLHDPLVSFGFRIGQGRNGTREWSVMIRKYPAASLIPDIFLFLITPRGIWQGTSVVWEYCYVVLPCSDM